MFGAVALGANGDIMTAGLFAERRDWFGVLENALSKEEEAEYRTETTCWGAGLPCDPPFIHLSRSSRHSFPQWLKFIEMKFIRRC